MGNLNEDNEPRPLNPGELARNVPPIETEQNEPRPVNPAALIQQPDNVRTSPIGAMQTGIATGADGNRIGIYGSSVENFGVYGDSTEGAGVYGTGKLAALFEGDVEITGDIRLTNADCAEDFDILETEAIEPGMVMVLGEEGTLRAGNQAYDKRVAGVISGAGNYKPGIVLDRQQTQSNRRAIALLGKTYCKVDAEYGSVEIGDLLTTSPTLGHAMRASDPSKAFGAVIGKALRPLREGQALIPILIALQ